MKKTEYIPTVDPEAKRESKPPSKLRASLSFRNISAIYIFIGLFIIFALLTPKTFLNPGTWIVLLDAQSITVLAAVAVLIPLVNGVFHLGLGGEVGFGCL